VREPLVVPKIEVRLRAVFGHKHFTVLKGLIVPGSTFRYGSHFCRVTLKPRLSRRQPIEEAATPFPSEENTAGYKNIFWRHPYSRVPTPGLFALHRSDVRIIIVGTRNSVKSNSPLPQNGFFYGILEALAPKPLSIGPFLNFMASSSPRLCVHSRST